MTTDPDVRPRRARTSPEPDRRGIGHRLAALWRSRRKTGDRPRLRTRLLTGGVCALAGLMIVASALSARGSDLRPDRNTDLVGLLNAEKSRNAQLAEQVGELRAEVDRLTAARQSRSPSAEQSEQKRITALTAVAGPSLTVTLTDAPPDIHPAGVDDDSLVVHQQDIQAVANALWLGGAEAMTIQGQRVVSTTGIKCVGNTVVLHGVPYAPPYVITAIGDPNRLDAALKSSPYLQIYQQYVEAFGLGWSQQSAKRTVLPGYDGPLKLNHAHVPGAVATPGR